MRRDTKQILPLRACCYTFFFFSSRRRHTRLTCDWSSDVCSSDLANAAEKDLAALAVFTTGDPTAEMAKVRDDMLSRPLPSPSPFVMEAGHTNTDFCVFQSSIDMPDYQAGATPFATDGGDWQFDGAGKPILQRLSTSRVWLTIPNRPMPANGFPVVVFVVIGGGNDRPMVDRGTCATE